MDAKLATGNSLSDVARLLGTSPALEQPLTAVARALPEGSATRTGLERLHRDDPMSVRAFLERTWLHRILPGGYAPLLAGFKHWAAHLAPGTPPAAFDLDVDDLTGVESLAELVPFVEQAGLADTMAIDAWGAFSLPRAVYTRLLRSFGATLPLIAFLHRADDALQPRDHPVVLDAIIDWLIDELDELDGPTSNVIPLTSASRQAVALREKVRAFGIPDLEDWPVDLLDGTPGRYPGTLVSTAVNAPSSGLEGRLTRFQARLRGLSSAASAKTLVPVEPPALAALQQAAWAERVRLLKAYPWGLHASQLQYRASGSDLELRVGLNPGWPPSLVTASDLPRWADGVKLSCSCARSMCLHRVAVLEGLSLGLHQDPELCDEAKVLLRPRWERLFDEAARAPAPKPRERGVLSVEVSPLSIGLRYHAIGKRGAPSKSGRHVRASEVLARVEGRDLQIAERLAIAGAGYSVKDNPAAGDALLLLVGHPRVSVSGSGGACLPVERVQASVRVDTTKAGYTLCFGAGDLTLARLPPCFRSSQGQVALLQEPARILVVEISPAFVRLFEAAQRHGVELPREAAPALIQALPALEAGATVDLPEDLRGDERPPQSRPLVRVLPAGAGLALAIRVEPLERGPTFVPGHGVPVSATFDGRRRAFTRRDFAREVAEASAVAGALGLDPSAAGDDWAFPLGQQDAHVEVLRRLATLEVPVEWEAPRVRFTQEARLDGLRLAVTRKRDWFGLDGEVTVDDRRVSLALLLEAARARRRFVRLGEGDYAQLSQGLLEQLSPLAHLGAPGKPVELTLGAAPLLDALAPQVQALEAAKEWSALLQKLATARQASFPVPRALKATLRDYQRDGFEWLSRLAQWGTGAVLADDMGLGKTLQALALLLARAKSGPAVVVAPSSVVHTWRTEAARFAPSLKLALYHEGARSLAGLGAGDVVVVSWTMFARDAEAFAAAGFATAVLDEAHAIKNAGTLRAKAAQQLGAGFVVALSGTPVENHVGELWSLFRAVMPSLFGSEESFKARFASGSKEALGALAALVRPFILRRAKSAVARELPPRTDLELLVPLSPEERALYDDVRLATVAKLGDVTGDAQRFEILAALTRLRLTACHPRLVDGAWQGPTSKLTRLLELLADLADGGHRVLVFSQFTSHLALVMEALRGQGVAFTSLDGKTPLAERQRRVEAFQRGEGGDVFLISLKAGGTGLTLTAADYVIHLDPWWNPAVEDQASDRAHRLGQDKPVTVYRLIAEGTIEQQILSLHAQKRELVDALLSGADSAGKLSTVQLAELIRGGGAEAA